MLKAYVLSICLSMISLTTAFCQTFQNEGLVNLKSMVAPKGVQHYTWFKDSTVILEVYQHFTETINDSVVWEGPMINKYAIIDLTTLRAQDYLTFSDTATPVTNYRLNDSDHVPFGLVARDHPYDKYFDTLNPMSDTIIESKMYRRFYFDLSDTSWHQRMTYYLLCSDADNIFHMSRGIDTRNPGCKVMLVQYTDMRTGDTNFSKLEIIRNRLTGIEERIFEKWKQNLQSSVLPLTTANEAFKILFEFKRQKHDIKFLLNYDKK